jgi:hypothetical protein
MSRCASIYIVLCHYSKLKAKIQYNHYSKCSERHPAMLSSFHRSASLAIVLTHFPTTKASEYDTRRHRATSSFRVVPGRCASNDFSLGALHMRYYALSIYFPVSDHGSNAKPMHYENDALFIMGISNCTTISIYR